MNSLMLCLLQETVIRLLQSEFIGQKSEKPTYRQPDSITKTSFWKRCWLTSTRLSTSQSTIAEICQKFSMSRSSLQILFKENMDMPPKKYINELKLEKSRQMICENKYTISEIALMLGFNSIHYFSTGLYSKVQHGPQRVCQNHLQIKLNICY